MRRADPTTTLTLDVLGYEFPALRHDPYDFDANWLRVRLTLEAPTGQRRVEGPYLPTWAVARRRAARALRDALVAWPRRFLRGA